MSNNLSKEFKDEVRKQAKTQAAKWSISAFVALLAAAVFGWWLYLQPKIEGYIHRVAGGVPSGTIVISKVPCKNLGDGWKIFEEGTGRFVVGAGQDFSRAYTMWDQRQPNGQVKRLALSGKELLSIGGEETHILSTAQLAKHAHPPPTKSTFYLWHRSGPQGNINFKSHSPEGWIDHNRDGIRTTGVEGESDPFGLLPPYIALNYCLRTS